MNSLPDSAVSWKGLNYEMLRRIPIQPRPRGNQRQRKGSLRYYKDVVCAFDIETSKTEDRQAFMYVWQFQIGMVQTVAGRRWREFINMLRRMADDMEPDQYYVIYCHNLSHEFSFLSGIYHFKPEEVFAMDDRKVLRCDMFNHFEFRCSYIHSNMSLDVFLRKMGVTHLKLSGEAFNYSKVRYPWTPLDPEEWEYCLNDVRGLVEAIQIEMRHDGDTLYTIPSTSTGYVRRDVKKCLRMVNYHFIKDQLPNVHIYTMLREAFRGGNTHANRYFAGRILHNVKSADRSSAYPSEECTMLFPVSKFFEMKKPPSKSELLHLIYDRGKAVIARIYFEGIRLKKETWPCPYISKDKCRFIDQGVYDNGRVLSAKSLEITVTDLDLEIIMDEYFCDKMKVFDCAYARYGPLPVPLIKCIEEYYRTKTDLTNVKGMEIYREKSKNKLNSIYGLSAMNPIRLNTEYHGSRFRTEATDNSIIDGHPAWLVLKIQEYQRRGFFPYQWGCWCTAWARYHLEEGIRLADQLSEHDPRCGFVYCDTDSVKYIGDIDWDEHNREQMEASRTAGAFATDPKGITHYMGVFEYEGCYPQFATRGAKKYVYTSPGIHYHLRIDKDGSRHLYNNNVHATIAGVNKKKGGQELAENGGLPAFLRKEFTFTKAGGTESVYNDRIREIREIDGHQLRITKNVAICDSTYTLSDTPEYAMLLEDSSIIQKFMLDKFGVNW